MKQVEYTAPDGRLYAVLVPEDAPACNYRMGIVVGPPVLDDALPYLPQPILVAFHNELYVRRFYTYSDLEGRRSEIHAALVSALRHNVVDDTLEVYRKAGLVSHEASNH